MPELYKQALLNKYRYPTTRGEVSTEDLFDMKLKGTFSLNAVAIALYAIVKATNEEDFIGDAAVSTVTDHDVGRLEVVKTVIAHRKAQNESTAKARETRLQKAKLLAILSNKKDEELSGKTTAQLEAMITALG